MAECALQHAAAARWSALVYLKKVSQASLSLVCSMCIWRNVPERSELLVVLVRAETGGDGERWWELKRLWECPFSGTGSSTTSSSGRRLENRGILIGFDVDLSMS